MGSDRVARWLPWLLLGAVVGRFLWESWAPHAQIDDAFISYRYAANLVAGHGLVFNPGERVEGFTNLLWTLLVAAGIGMGFEATRVAHVLGLASGVALLVATCDYTRLLLPRERAWAAVVPPALLGCTTAFGVWTTSGLETPLFAALVTAGLAASARGRPGLATAIALLATATRPEGVLLAAALYLPDLPELARRFRDGWRAWRWPLVFGGGIALLTLFRLVYYGQPLPNTFYAKVGGIPLTRGLLYTMLFLHDGSGWLLVPAAFALARERRVAPGFLLVGLVTAFVIAVGGDVFPDDRFFLPVLPALAALAVRGASRAWTRSPYLGLVVGACVAQAAVVSEFGSGTWPLRLAVPGCALLGAAALRLRRPWLLPVCVALAAVALAAAVPSARDQAIERRLRGFQAGEDLARNRARILSHANPPVQLVAAMGIGAFGYFSNLPVLDLLGLVDPVIARSSDDPEGDTWQLPGHARSNADYVLSRIPDVILMSPEHDLLPLPAARDLHEDPRFQRYYRWDKSIAGYRLRRHRRELPPSSDRARE